MMGFGLWRMDATYVLVLIGFVITMIASARVKSTFNKYSGIASAKGITGAEAARIILTNAGIHDVQIRHISGSLTDNYDPVNKVLNLSDSVYGSTSVAAVGVAAHECGHAIQHDEAYAPLAIRSAILPAANIGSRLSWPIFIAGLIFSFGPLLDVGIILFMAAVAFQIVTLPVEFNASARALRLVEQDGIFYQEEVRDAKKVLSAAAMTYVAAVAASMLQLLRLILLANSRKGRR